MGKIIINTDRCKGCGLCVSACPNRLIVLSKTINSGGMHPAVFAGEKERCTGCSLCAMMCPDMAIEVYKDS